MEDVVILSACRTPIGSFCGSLSSLHSHDLGSIVIKDALKRANVPCSEVSEVIMGQTLTAGEGQNPARQASIKAGLPVHVPAYSINMLCGSGLKAVMAAYQSIRSGDSTIVVCGGQESMSQAPHTLRLRESVLMGPAKLQDSMLIDGLTDAMNGVHMGLTAEEIAKIYNISREEQDLYACESQRRTKEAQANGLFSKEIVPVQVSQKKETKTISIDEFPKPDTTMEKLSKLRTVFKNDGSVTAGNASGINDGAAALVLCSRAAAEKHNFKPIAKIISVAQTGLEPMQMGLGPISAVTAVLKKAGWSKSEVEVYELNEAFAAQTIAVLKDLDLSTDNVNINGGAIALGHPIGASGARVLVTLLHVLEQKGKVRGVASLCVGGGMGIAMAIERYNL